ncbi:MAG: hypothetical protein GF329_13270 [Candidatus Lokiarchaeota archaeon]|nr:hypothetical protein [Candidatus Lokiarchaeota archaeon]
MKDILTMIGKRQARIGYKFRFIGASEKCRNCKKSIRKVCLNTLEKNHVYEIVKVRKKTHHCKVHADGVVVVKVRAVPIKVAIKSKLAHEGSTIKYKPIKCNQWSCPLYNLCLPIELRDSSKNKYRIMKVIERKKSLCKKNLDLTIVEIEKS